ncbi:MAG TPA: alpha-L-rhamnosidase C-terminal domain-containing protein [Mucilaginibacter sp.]|nr:alpha-L-rhamnosidase C-terminal domain-containing protein [Mucilaginibacter sp.]
MNNFKHLASVLCCLVTINAFSQQNAPTGLLCNLLSHPESAVITHKIPDFGWIVNAGVKDDYQSAYRVQVATSAAFLLEGRPDLWDSEKILSGQSINITYKGKSLQPHQHYYWRVCTWGRMGKQSLWSSIQKFNTSDFDLPRPWPGESKWVELPDENGKTSWTFENREPVNFHDVAPSKYVVHKNGYLYYDFKKDAFAYLTLNVSWDDKIKTDSLEVSIGEKGIGDSIDQKPGGGILYNTYKIGLKTGVHDYILELPRFVPQFPHSEVMPLQMPEVIPFRYAEIKAIPGLKVNSITQKALYVKFNPNASSFSCSDDKLNQIYELCKYSTIANTFNGDYANSERERMMYEADCYIQQMSHYAIDRDFATARYSTENLIYHASWPTEWINHSVFMAWADYLYTGNKELIENYYNDLKAKTLIGLETSEGLISSRTGLQTKSFLASIHFDGDMIHDIDDWPDAEQGIYPYGETDNYERKDYNTVVNAFYYRALVLMGRIALATNHKEDVAFFEAKAEKVKKKFNEDFFDSVNKIYFDGIGSRHFSLQANMFPLAFGLVPDEYKESVVNYVKSKWMACSVYAANYLMEALYNSEQGDYALELMTNDSDRGWLNMIRVGATMTTEAWDIKYDPHDISWSHAWSASPAHIIPRKIMGIEPAEPGYGKINIKPQPGDLKWAKMKLPTIRGEITVDLNQDQGNWFDLDTNIPANTTAKVYLPKLPGKYTLMVDGRITKNAATEGNWVVVNSASGSHTFRIRKG